MRPTSSRPVRVSVLAATLLAVAVLPGCSGGDAGVSGQRYVAGDSSITLVPKDQRREPVVMSGTTLDGAHLDLAGFRGKPVVLNVWASWCGPCRKEAPDLQALATSSSDAAFVGLNTQDNADAARAFQRSFAVSYPSLVEDGSQLLALRGAVPPTALPSTVVLDAQGRVAVVITGATTKATLGNVINVVAAGGTTLDVTATPPIGSGLSSSPAAATATTVAATP